MGHHELATPPFGSDVIEDRLHFGDRVRQDRIRLQALLGCTKHAGLHFSQKLVQAFANRL